MHREKEKKRKEKMGGKGQRRREKNFRAAHGGSTSLPPPPKSRDINALPSKLRQIMEFRNPLPKLDSSNTSVNFTPGKRKGGVVNDQKKGSKDNNVRLSAEILEGGSDKDLMVPKNKDERDETTDTEEDKRKGKRKKRKTMDDLRLQSMSRELTAIGSKRQERRKTYLKEKKKKHKKAKPDETREFPGHEEIKFGEVVEAPPKLTFPKVTKSFQDASHERLRLQAVESYRNRKGWVSRPGVLVPPVTATPPSGAA